MASRYNQLRVDDASRARKTASETAIQQALRIHSRRGMIMEPDFQMGFDEALTAGRTCGEISVSGKQYGSECTSRLRFQQGQSTV